MAEDVGKGVVSIEADTKGLGKDIGDKISKESGGLSKLFGSIGKTAGAAFKVAAVAAVAGVAAGAAFAKGAVDAASDLSESMSKVNVVFGDASKDVVAWSETSAKAFGQSQQSALEAAGTYGNLFQAFGIAQKPAQEMSQTLTELAADLASFNNTSVEEALQALQSGVSGETEPLKRYGIAINDVRLKEQALAMGLIKTTKDALTPAAKAQASYALILQDTTLAQGDFARTSDGLANQQRILSAQFQNVKAKIGAALIPAFTAIVGLLSTKVLPVLGKVWDSFQTAFSGEGIVSDGFWGVIEMLGARLRLLVEWVKANWPQIREVLVTVLTEAFNRIGQLFTWFQTNILPGLMAAFQEIVGWVQRNWPTIKAVAGAILEALGATINWLVQVVLPALVDALTATANWIRNDLVPALVLAYQWFNDNIMPVLQAVAGFVVNQLIPAVVSFATTMTTIVVVAIGAVVVAATTLWNWWQTLWERSEGLRSFLAGAFKLAFDTVTTAVGGVRGAVELVTIWLQTFWDKSEGVRAFLAGAFWLAVTTVKTAFDGVVTVLGTLWSWMQTAWDKGAEVAGFFEGPFNTAVGVIKAGVGFLADAFGAVVDAIQWVIDKANAAMGPLRAVIDLAGKIPGVGGTAGVGDMITKGTGARAMGGPVIAGRSYVVGEGGWEIFQPKTDGMILSHADSVAALSGGSGTKVEFTGDMYFGSDVDVDGFSRTLNFQLAGV